MGKNKKTVNTNLLSEIDYTLFDDNKSKNIENIQNQILNAEISNDGKSTIYRIPIAFDTETSTFSGHSYIYIWQMTVGTITYYGRYWRDFIDILKSIANVIEHNIIIGIANTGFDMSFYDIPLIQLSHNENYCYNQLNSQPHHPILCEFGKKSQNKEDKHGIIKIVDICKISGLSLEKIGKNFCKHKKMVGCLDYSKVRTSATPIKEWELSYCLFDTVVASEYLEYLYTEFTDKGIKFPLTATAMLRNDIKEMAKETKFDVKSVSTELFPKFYSDYKYYMNFLFRGGFTHANRFYTGKTVTNVTCVDYTSSYPAEMFLQKYPVERFKKFDGFNGEYKSRCGKFKEFQFENDTAYIFDITIYDMRAITFHSVESVNKICKTELGTKLVKGLVEDNGRILQADKVKLCVTELDYLILQKYYYCSKIVVENCKKSKKGYLPDYVLKPMLRAYVEKTKLKNQKLNNNPEYFVAKGKVNAGYGCTVQKLNLVSDELTVEYNDDLDIESYIYEHIHEWQKLKNTAKYKDKEQCELEQIAYMNAKRNKILSCWWGIYVTAYARYKLLMQVCEIEQIAPNCVVYCDTDSMYIKDFKKVKHIIDDWNKKTLIKNKKFLPKEAYDLNTLDVDPPCLYFKTLGAKRYVKSYFVNNILETTATIAGLKKGVLEKECGYDRELIYKTFDNAMMIKKESTKKLVPSYDYTQYYDTVVDYNGIECECEQYGGCVLVSVDFTLTMSSDYIKLVENYVNERIG